MWDFSIGTAIAAMFRTWPFIVFRIVIYFGITLAYILVTGTGAGIGYGAGYVADAPDVWAMWGAFIGFGVVSGVLYWVREYILYLVKAAHIAVLVEVLEGKPLPEGRGQVDYGQKIVREHFAQANILFALDQLVKGVLRVITGTINTIAFILPIPALEQAARIVNGIIRLSLTYVDEIILAYNFRLRSQNPWETSRHALILYAQNYGTFVKNAVWMGIFMWVLTIIVFLFFLAPAAAILYVMPGQLGGFGFILAFLFAWSVKAAFIEPFAIACLMQAYFKRIEGQTPDADWDRRLSSMSDKFRKMGEEALAWARGRPAPQQPPAPQPAV